MMNGSPIIVEDKNLSIAWYRILKLLIASGNGEVSPLVLTLTDFLEVESIRNTLDASLVEKNTRLKKGKKPMPTVQTVSETIFPQSLYEYAGYDRDKLYNIYKKNLPRIKKLDTSNRKGTYFSRLIAFGEVEEPVNQLDIIISALKEKGPRRSKSQAAIFDPHKDHTNSRMQGFPCLQHVTFVKTKNGGMIMNSFYAIQFFYKRAYGNWLGLINLGKFVANESGLRFERFNCFIGAETLENENVSKAEAKKILSTIDAVIIPDSNFDELKSDEVQTKN